MPFSCYKRMNDTQKSILLHDCVDTRILKIMANKLNFTYVTFEPQDLQWGYRLKNGSFTGKFTVNTV